MVNSGFTLNSSCAFEVVIVQLISAKPISLPFWVKWFTTQFCHLTSFPSFYPLLCPRYNFCSLAQCFFSFPFQKASCFTVLTLILTLVAAIHSKLQLTAVVSHVILTTLLLSLSSRQEIWHIYLLIHHVYLGQSSGQQLTITCLPWK